LPEVNPLLNDEPVQGELVDLENSNMEQQSQLSLQENPEERRVRKQIKESLSQNQRLKAK